MFERRVLKNRGKAAFRNNYWRAVLVALILTLTAGGTGTSGGSTVRQVRQGNDVLNQYDIDDYNYDPGAGSLGEMWNIDDFEEPGDIDGIEDIEDLYNIGGPGSGSGIMNGLMASGLMGLVIVVMLVAIVLAAALSIFLLNPLAVGCRRFFLANSNFPADAGHVGFAFKSDYKNVVKVCFFRDIYIFLWSLLLIVPGIIKAYDYRLVAYLLAENPSMNTKEALETSTKMMYGNKWDSFLLDFSFIGWYLLSVLTLGILGIFYVDPYVAATDAELYKTLSGKTSGFDEFSDEVGMYRQPAGGVQAYNPDGRRENNEDVYVTFDMTDDTSTHD